MKTPAFLRLAWLTTLLAFASLPALPLSAEVRTLTDTQGRKIEADVLSVENDTVKIKRSDGQEFDLPLANLIPEDRKALKAWAAKNPPKLPPVRFDVNLSRVRISVEKDESSGGGSIISREKWGYTLDLANRGPRELKNLRAEYILFVKQDDFPGQPKGERSDDLKRKKYKQELEPLLVHETRAVRTEPIETFRQKLAPGWVWGGAGGNKPIRDTLHGIWLRVYDGDQLIHESSTPETLMTREKW